MTVEEIYIKLRDELTADNESSSSPERIFIKNEEQTICTLGMNRSHEIIFVEFKPSLKDLAEIEREGFVHPHPVEMLHDAGWRQAQITNWEEAEKLLEIINRSYKKKKPKSLEHPISKTRKGVKIPLLKKPPVSASAGRPVAAPVKPAPKQVAPTKLAPKTKAAAPSKKAAAPAKKQQQAKPKAAARPKPKAAAKRSVKNAVKPKAAKSKPKPKAKKK